MESAWFHRKSASLGEPGIYCLRAMWKSELVCGNSWHGWVWNVRENTWVLKQDMNLLVEPIGVVFWVSNVCGVMPKEAIGCGQSLVPGPELP